MIRSYLFVPAIDQHKMNKAIKSEADAIIFDLEDAVEFESKSKARELLKEFLRINQVNQYTVIRINSIEDKMNYIEDLLLAVQSKVNAIMLPKVNNDKEVMIIESKMNEIIRKNNLEDSIEIIPIIETVEGVYSAYKILLSSSKIKKIAFGAVDFALDLKVEEPHPILIGEVRAKLSMESRLANKEKPIDSAFIDIQNMDALKEETQLANGMGFYGKMAIHPKQINIINSVFSYSQDQIRNAELIVKRFEDALNEGVASINVNGKMIDYPVYKQAKEILYHTEV